MPFNLPNLYLYHYLRYVLICADIADRHSDSQLEKQIKDEYVYSIITFFLIYHFSLHVCVCVCESMSVWVCLCKCNQNDLEVYISNWNGDYNSPGIQMERWDGGE